MANKSIISSFGGMSTMWGPQTIAKLVQITLISSCLFGTQITIVTGVYKPTYPLVSCNMAVENTLILGDFPSDRNLHSGDFPASV